MAADLSPGQRYHFFPGTEFCAEKSDLRPSASIVRIAAIGAALRHAVMMASDLDRLHT
ncbi:hypothetical protein [Hyphomicrobium sp. ghe19]|uniref:hypothetical protein n=1 Tax=Hyphomicrobium sp. ghe19 TaxID=2682968 RepID=UPI0030D3742B